MEVCRYTGHGSYLVAISGVWNVSRFHELDSGDLRV